MMGRFSFIIVLLALLFELALTISPYSAFTVDSSSKEVHSVSVAFEEPPLECTFKYRASPCKVKTTSATKPKPKGQRVDLLKALQGRCLEKRDNYWTFEVCVGGQAKQVHGGDVFKLGTHSALSSDGTALLHDKDGTPCDGLPDKAPRRSIIKMLCGPDDAIVSVQEPSMCFYEITATSPAVCGDARFTKFSGTINSAEARVSDRDSWFLELSKTDDESFVCTAHLVQTGKHGKPVACFDGFQMISSITSDDSSASSIAFVSARTFDHKSLSATDFVMPEDNMIALLEQNIGTNLEYLSIHIDV